MRWSRIRCRHLWRNFCWEYCNFQMRWLIQRPIRKRRRLDWQLLAKFLGYSDIPSVKNNIMSLIFSVKSRIVFWRCLVKSMNCGTEQKVTKLYWFDEKSEIRTYTAQCRNYRNIGTLIEINFREILTSKVVTFIAKKLLSRNFWPKVSE